VMAGRVVRLSHPLDQNLTSNTSHSILYKYE
jgi:hypothetical protein